MKINESQLKKIIKESVKKILKENLAVANGDVLFTKNNDGKTLLNTSEINNVFQRLLKKYDILDATVKGKVTCHSLRHTYATRCIESGMQPNTLKKLLAIVMILTMLFAFAACGGNNEETTTTAAPETTVAEETTVADVTEAPAVDDTTAPAVDETTAAADETTAADATREYSNVGTYNSGAAYSSTNTFFTVYNYAVTYAKGSNV